MPPSQLKRLKSSLREKGIVGPQKSKKQKRQASKNGSFNESRIQRGAALQNIREQYNPFDIRGPSKSKYEFASTKNVGDKEARASLLRPGVTKGLGEENRRKTLLIEIQRKKKIGGILDRRFGENDPTMTLEEKALERFVREKQRRDKKGSLFDLEDEEEDVDLTHGGKSLSFNNTNSLDDFDQSDLTDIEEDQTDRLLQERPTKRQKLSVTGSSGVSSFDQTNVVQPERPKTKREVMEDIISKSKLHKYERQKAKEDDDELRAQLDQDLPNLLPLMRETLKAPPPLPPPPPSSLLAPNAGMNPDRMALLNGKDRAQADKEYDERLRQMALDQRAKPTERTKTEEEKLQQEAQRLEDLEARRLARMRGELEDSDADEQRLRRASDGDDTIGPDEESDFGLGSGLPSQQRKELGVEDEDEFVVDEGLITDVSDLDQADEGSEDEIVESRDSDDEEFVRGLLSKEDAGREDFVFSNDQNGMSKANSPNGDLAYTYQCPQTHDEMLNATLDVPVGDLPTVVQRIRALYHPKLASANRDKLGNFAAALVDHISYLANETDHPPFAVLEALIRHVHSLAKIFSEQIGRAFRSHLKVIHDQRSTELTAGDVLIFTAIGTIFPTSDHFHQVVTPAMLCMTRYLSQKIPVSLCDLSMGTYIVTLCQQYQQYSKRYMPEVVNYVINFLWALAPTKPTASVGAFPYHTLPDILRLRDVQNRSVQRKPLEIWNVLSVDGLSDDEKENLKVSLLHGHLALIENIMTIWNEQSAFCEVFGPIYTALQFLCGKSCSSKLDHETLQRIQSLASTLHTHLQSSLSARTPLRLHHHRPLAIKLSIPKFEESYNPDKHYDPDRERAEASKLKAEHKREKKGALRELRKDANFIAREGLREKRERDGAYERKYKRLVAEIQGEEGREKKVYEREKRARKGKGRK